MRRVAATTMSLRYRLTGPRVNAYGAIVFERKDAVSIALIVGLANSGCPTGSAVERDEIHASSGDGATDDGSEPSVR